MKVSRPHVFLDHAHIVRTRRAYACNGRTCAIFFFWLLLFVTRNVPWTLITSYTSYSSYCSDLYIAFYGTVKIILIKKQIKNQNKKNKKNAMDVRMLWTYIRNFSIFLNSQSKIPSQNHILLMNTSLLISAFKLLLEV